MSKLPMEWAALVRVAAEARGGPEEPLPDPIQATTFDRMSEQRLTALETHFEYVRKDLEAVKVAQTETNRVLADVSASLVRVFSQMSVDKADIRTDIATLRAETAKLPTRSDLTSWKLQWMALGFAVVALVVGGVIGGLGWLASVLPASGA